MRRIECDSPRLTRRGGLLVPVSPTLELVVSSPEEKARVLAAAKSFRGLKVPGKRVDRGVRRLMKLRWHGSVESAAIQAVAEDKPILWIQALGDLEGFT